MKKTILKNWMAALLLSGVCCGFVACNNNDENPMPTPVPDAAVVMGAYDGTMDIFAVVPNEGEEDQPADAQLDATVTGDLIQFTDFPIRDLVIKVLGDETLADQIVEKIGQVDYAVPYTALMNEDKAGVTLTLTPEPLKLSFSNDAENGGPESFEEPVLIEIEVEVIAQTEGVYSIESKNLGFRISAASVKIAGNELPGFEPFTLSFDLTKN